MPKKIYAGHSPAMSKLNASRGKQIRNAFGKGWNNANFGGQNTGTGRAGVPKLERENNGSKKMAAYKAPRRYDRLPNPLSPNL